MIWEKIFVYIILINVNGVKLKIRVDLISVLHHQLNFVLHLVIDVFVLIRKHRLLFLVQVYFNVEVGPCIDENFPEVLTWSALLSGQENDGVTPWIKHVLDEVVPREDSDVIRDLLHSLLTLFNWVQLI